MGNQHREVQGEETEAFRSYFPSGIEFLEGGYVDHSNKAFRSTCYM